MIEIKSCLTIQMSVFNENIHVCCHREKKRVEVISGQSRFLVEKGIYRNFIQSRSKPGHWPNPSFCSSAVAVECILWIETTHTCETKQRKCRAFYFSGEINSLGTLSVTVFSFFFWIIVWGYALPSTLFLRRYALRVNRVVLYHTVWYYNNANLWKTT